MKKLLYPVLSILLIVLVACQSAAAPDEVVTGLVDAYNAGDVDAFVAQYADDAVVTIKPPPPGVEGESLLFTGLVEIRGWAEGLMEDSGHYMDMEITQSDGQTVIGKSAYTNDNLNALGVVLQATDEYVVRDGKIASQLYSVTDESMKALTAALAAMAAEQAQAVVQRFINAQNAGDVDAALALLADDAVIQLIPPPMEGHDGVFSGKEEIRDWYVNLISLHGTGAISDVQVSGDQVTALLTYGDDGLKELGVDTIDNHWVVTLQEGKIQGYTATMTDESLAALMAAME